MSENNAKWWTEKELKYNYKGKDYPLFYYEWPQDRPIYFAHDDNGFCTNIVYSFAVDKPLDLQKDEIYIDKAIEDMLKMSNVPKSKRRFGFSSICVSVIKIKCDQHRYAMFLSEKKCFVETNFHRYSNIKNSVSRKELEKHQEWSPFRAIAGGGNGYGFAPISYGEDSF